MVITNAQRLERLQYLGSSEVASVLGLNPWSDAWTVWARRKYHDVHEQHNQTADLGNALEEGILDWYASKQQLTLSKNVRFQRGTVFSCHTDAIITDGIEGELSKEKPWVVEVKTTSRAMDYKDNDVPEWTYMQVQQQMYCSGATKAIVIALTPGHGELVKPLFTEVERDAETIDWMLNTCIDWWQEHIIGGREPERTNKKGNQDYVKRIREREGESYAGGAKHIKVYQELLIEKKMRADLDQKIKAKETWLKADMGERECLVLGELGEELIYKSQKRTTYGKDPGKYGDCCTQCGVGHKQSAYRVLRSRSIKHG